VRGRRLALLSFAAAAVLTAFLFVDGRFRLSPVASDAEAPIAAINGAYTEKHQVRSVDGSSETAEDVVEIARYDPTHVFVRIVTHFDVGHSCGASGIAAFEDEAFVYRSRQSVRGDEPTCTLKLAMTANEVRITDRPDPNGPATCRALCGARGSLSDVSFSRMHRRPIPEMTLLKESEEYAAAVKEFNEKTAGGTRDQLR
jgi:hypothetical protein